MVIVWRFLKQLRIELPHIPEILLLCLYPKEIKSVYRRDICSHVFATLFPIARKWEEHVSIN
jgi:hypothetical protein